MDRVLKFMIVLLILLSSACSNIIGEAPEQSQGRSYMQTQPGADNSVNDEEVLRKKLISLRQQDQIAQAQRLRSAKQVQKKALDKKHNMSNAGKQMQPVEESLWIRIPFKSGYTSVQQNMHKALTDVAGKFLAESRQQSLVVRGFCDAEPIGGYGGKHRSRHSFESQLALSQQRAQEVADILIRAGIPRASIRVEAYGAKYFIADNDTVSGRNKNRRVDVFVLNY